MDITPTKILLGPTNELHTGAHGSLITHPVTGYRYVAADAAHNFLFPKNVKMAEGLSPHRHFHLAEVLHFSDYAPIIHTSRFPAVEHSAWVMDLDNFGYPFVGGRALLNPEYRKGLSDRRDPIGLHAQARRRTMNMLYACGHPSCRAVLFWTETELKSAKRQIAASGLEKLGSEFLTKCQVVYPAQAPVAKEKVKAKWEALEAGRAPPTVIFCGRDFAVKNGAVALEVFDRLLQRKPHVRIIYIGHIPDSHLKVRAGLLRKIEFHSDLRRTDVLDRLAASHILFHPSRSESFGMIYLEAFAAGLAVIGASGDGLCHISEILNPEGARLVHHSKRNHSLWVNAYAFFLEALAETPDISKRLGYYNYELVALDSSKFSITGRNRKLKTTYSACAADGPKLHLEELPYWNDSVLFSIKSDEVLCDLVKYAHEIGFDGSNVVG
jgi:glycosyltransferase involved in cell wall biosynthesis